MRKKLHLIAVLIALYLPSMGQSSTLDQYLDIALAKNTVIKQQTLVVAKAQLQLKETKNNYLPKISLNARFSRAVGGRTYEIPIGDLLNPVYDNLNVLNNQISDINPSTALFTDYNSIANEELYFLRQQEQETYVRMTFPLFNSHLNRTRQLQTLQNLLAEAELSGKQKEVLYEVKAIYYNYLKIKGLQKVLHNASLLLKEQAKTTKSLMTYHKVTVDYLYAIEANSKAVEKEVVALNKKEKMAIAYFNKLLDQPYATPMPTIAVSNEEIHLSFKIEQAIRMAHQYRKESRQMEITQEMAAKKTHLQKAKLLPQINFIGDYGIQGNKYEFKNNANYAMGSIVLSWDLFHQGNQHKIAQSKIEEEILTYQHKSWRDKIELEVLDAYYEVETALKNIELTKAEKESVAKIYQLVRKKFEQGQASLIEITAARTQLINANQEIILAKYDYNIKRMRLEQAIGH